MMLWILLANWLEDTAASAKETRSLLLGPAGLTLSIDLPVALSVHHFPGNCHPMWFAMTSIGKATGSNSGDLEWPAGRSLNEPLVLVPRCVFPTAGGAVLKRAVTELRNRAEMRSLRSRRSRWL